MKYIAFVSHCLLNTAAKVVMYNDSEMAQEEALRRSFLSDAVGRGLQLVQLPCPEFLMYGARRWGHVSEQFDTPFFRTRCRELLKDTLMQMKEYISQDGRFTVLGVIGIDGSPSCGVDYTCFGPWGGNLGDRADLTETVAAARMGRGMGVMMDELKKMLAEEGIDLPFTGLFAPEPEKLKALLDRIEE